jgi:hypothetical protein
MKPHPLLLVAGLVCFVACLIILSRSPAWAQLRYFDFLAMLGAGISLGTMISWIGARFGPKQAPRG